MDIPVRVYKVLSFPAAQAIVKAVLGLKVIEKSCDVLGLCLLATSEMRGSHRTQ